MCFRILFERTTRTWSSVFPITTRSLSISNLSSSATKHTNTNNHSPNKVTVWWDAGCPLCTKEINLMKRLDRNKAIEFIAIQDRTDSQMIGQKVKVQDCPVSLKELLARFHARDNQSQTIYNGAAAFALMW
jgi:predicted DCC family thiol-disulfide oxidoreductase YuxK